MKIKLASSIMRDSIVDGEGLRTVIWTQGCPRHCPGCHNPETIPCSGGKEFDVKEVIEALKDSNDGITFSGGDPFLQAKACSMIAKELKSKGKSIWCYTGYLYEELLKLSLSKPEIMEFLKYIDVLIDGPFIMAKKSMECLFRGSTNQRVIDVPKSLKNSKTIEVSKYKNEKLKNTQKTKDIYI